MKKALKGLGLFLFAATSVLSLQCSEDPDLDDFTIVEVSNEPAAKVKMNAEMAKKLLIKTQKKLKAIEEVTKSDELNEMVATTKSIARSLQKMAFKNGPGFEIANKTNSPIWVTVVANNKVKSSQTLRNCDIINPEERLALDLLNLKSDIKIAVYETNPIVVTYKDETFSPTPQFVYETTEGAQGKTKYLTWNPAKHNDPRKYLYPQTGRLKGLLKGSTSGYSLSNNLKQYQLSLTEMSEDEEEGEE